MDVLQAIFYFLLQVGLLPPYQGHSIIADPSNAVAAVLKPFDALTLLIAAIGHDVGHPGVNNAFLVALNAPLAQLYNDRSVLEAFHCAAYSQILRRYWPAAFADTMMRRLMINSILATDMGLHFKYIMDMGSLQEKMSASQSALDGWNAKVSDENRDLVCGLLMKCADISNVVCIAPSSHNTIPLTNITGSQICGRRAMGTHPDGRILESRCYGKGTQFAHVSFWRTS